MCVLSTTNRKCSRHISSASSAVLIRSPRLRRTGEKRFCRPSRNVCEMFIWSTKDFEGLLWERVLTLHNSDATETLGDSFLLERLAFFRAANCFFVPTARVRTKSECHSSLKIYIFIFFWPKLEMRLHTVSCYQTLCTVHHTSHPWKGEKNPIPNPSFVANCRNHLQMHSEMYAFSLCSAWKENLILAFIIPF